ncbi:MAG: helix-turn-helix transcriptional regulator [Clostridiales bacterium]|nr:helix-turn-helix transcriptional regulator [Clostridiales bacterium]
MSGDFTFLKGNIETIILCALYKEATYGYEIAKEIKERTSNKYEIKQPTLYSYLKRLEEDGLIESYWGENSNGGRRRYYALTDTGRANCEQFISEWQYQRTVLSELVDGTATGTEITQKDATPLFGHRTRRPRKKEYQAELDEQDEIARRLSELTGVTYEADDANDTVVEESEVVESVVEESIANEDTTEVQEEILFEDEAENTVIEQPMTAEQPTVIERIVYVDRPVLVEQPAQNVEETVATQQTEDTQAETLARFETNQDNPEDFIQAFDERAREVSDRQKQPYDTENYQHVLMNVIGNQLEGVNPTESDTTATTYYEHHQAALEDVADNLAKEGIRLRIYNHATATYKPKRLIPFAKVLCQTSWLTYAVAFVLFGVLTLSFITVGSWAAFIITLAALIAAPLGVTIYAILDPTRKEKPSFNFRIAIIIASVVCAIIILASVGFSALGNMDFSDTMAVSKQILIPTGIAVLIPASVAIYYTLYKRY